MSISLTPAAVLRRLLLAITVLVGLHGLGIVARFGFGHDQLKGLVPMFDLDREFNVPAVFSSLQLMLAAGACALVAAAMRRGDAGRRHWWGLAAMLVYMGLDELLELHERTIVPVREALGLGGALHYAWVLPFGLLALAVAGAYVGFLRRLPRRTAWNILVAGTVFILGAVACELVGSSIAAAGGHGGLRYVLVVTVEETMELVGIALLVHAALVQLCAPSGEFALRLHSSGTLRAG